MSELTSADKRAMIKEALSDALISCIGGSTAVIAVVVFSAFGILDGTYHFVYASYVLFCSGAITTLLTRMIKTYLGSSPEIKEKLREIDKEVAEAVEETADKVQLDLDRDIAITKDIAGSTVDIPSDQQLKEEGSWGTL